MLKTQWKLRDEWVQAGKLNKGKAAVTSALKRQIILVQANGKGVAFQWRGPTDRKHTGPAVSSGPVKSPDLL